MEFQVHDRIDQPAHGYFPTAARRQSKGGNNSDAPPDQAKIGISYFDRKARLDVKDVLHQIAWYRAQGMVKGDCDPTTMIDTRYVVPLPQ